MILLGGGIIFYGRSQIKDLFLLLSDNLSVMRFTSIAAGIYTFKMLPLKATDSKSGEKHLNPNVDSF